MTTQCRHLLQETSGFFTLKKKKEKEKLPVISEGT